jgi:hypothetical protein
VGYDIDGEFAAFGNNDDRVDGLTLTLVKQFMNLIRQRPNYRQAVPTQSIQERICGGDRVSRIILSHRESNRYKLLNPRSLPPTSP